MRSFPHSKRWHTRLAKDLSREAADRLILRAEVHYHNLMAGNSLIQSITPNMDKELHDLIYPVLAMYRAMLEEDPNQGLALEKLEILMKEDFFRGLGKGIGFLDFLPDPFQVIRPVLRRMTQSQYPPGFQVVVEDDRNCFAINAIRCFKLEVLTDLNAGELTGLYCKTDDWLSAKLPKIHWSRTKTLAQEHDMCDFRWSRVA